MDPVALNNRVLDIFEDALALHAAERPALLDRLCAGNEALRAEVECYLAAEAANRGDDFLRTPAALPLPASSAGTPSYDAAASPDAPGDLIGRRFGDFELREVLGGGG